MRTMLRRLTLASAAMVLLLGVPGTASAARNPLGTVDASPKSISFGKVAVGATVTQSFWITNNTKATLLITSLLYQGGDDFSYLSTATTNDCWDYVLDGILLAPGDSCGGAIAFHPTESGRHTWSTSFTFSDGVRSWSVVESATGTGL